MYGRLTLGLALALVLATAGRPQGHPPAVAASKMKVADGLTVSVVASEPDVRQPILVKFDARGRLWTIQYLQYPNPAGLKRVKVDRYSRTVFDRVPEPPPKGPKGADRITICTDADGDGRFDTFKDFVDGLNLCTGLAVGHGGVFVLQAPYLLFYPDADGDDRPDGDPEVLLSGFGMEDAQSQANHLTWGPDGWLYGLNGSTTTCDVRGIEFQQGVWRYHPLTKRFELFCEGGGNLFGLTFDADGNLFFSSNGNDLCYRAVQGGYYRKNFGKHGPLHHPHAYGFFEHLRYDGPVAGPTPGGTVYLGDSFPPRFRGAFLCNNFLQHAASWWGLKPYGTTSTATFRGWLWEANDTWASPTDLCLGPDGSVYICDFFDKRTAHPDPDADWDRSNGRICRIAAKGTKPAGALDLPRRSSRELVELLRHPNGWYGDQTRLLLAERRDRTVWPDLLTLARQTDDARLALHGAWGLYVSGGFTGATAAELLKHPAEYVRAWVVRLLGDERRVAGPLAKRLADLAANDSSAVVRLQLAATARRLPASDAWPIVEAILRRDLDADDTFLPLTLWWAVEDKALAETERLLAIFTSAEVWRGRLGRMTAERLVRRYAAEGTQAGYTACERLVRSAPAGVLVALDLGLAGRDARAEAPPAGLIAWVADAWRAEPDDPARLRLALRVGVTGAAERLRKGVGEGSVAKRVVLLGVLAELGTAEDVPAVLALVGGKEPAEVQSAALDALARHVDGPIADRLLAAYPNASTPMRSRMRDLLLSRPAAAKAFLERVDRGAVKPADVHVEQLRAVAPHNDPALDALVRKHWGTVAAGTPEEKLATVRRYTNDLRAAAGDRKRGREVFAKHCGTCHKLFGEGESIGPDLTGVGRSDRQALLTSIVDPNAVVRAQYVAYVAATKRGVVLTGLIAEQDAASVTLLDGQNRRTRLMRAEIEELRESPASLMPERLLDPLSPQELRDLFAYVQGDGMAK